MTVAEPPLSVSVSPAPARPVTLPPTEYEFVLHAICTFVTLAPPTVPLPLVTAHVCQRFVGEVRTVTAKGAPLATEVENVKAPFAPIARSSAALFWRTRPVPARPLTVPPMVKRVVLQATCTLVTFA